ncbi:MAG: hypothetical protein WKF37_13300 [Bryobacteraceae bacterium]
MIANQTFATARSNPFDPKTLRPSSTATVGAGSFESQLTLALSESLEKLGVKPGEINITIRNDARNQREILVSYKSTPSPAPAVSTAPLAPIVPEVKAAEPRLNWAPYLGPKDSRDGMPSGGGVVASDGSPRIEVSPDPVSNQYGYSGPAARNPYFTSPSNPLRDGYVLGFSNWFQEAMIMGGSAPMKANSIFYSTEEGAQEALRLAKLHDPSATVTNSVWGSDGGPYTASKPTWLIALSNGRNLNAGGVLHSYYNQGRGVTADSDAVLKRTIEST